VDIKFMKAPCKVTVYVLFVKQEYRMYQNMGCKPKKQEPSMSLILSRSQRLRAICLITTCLFCVNSLAQTITPKQRAAAKGFVLYEQGKVAQSVYWLKQAAELGDAASSYNLATMVLRQETSQLNQKQALAYLRQSADANFGLAQYLLGTLYEQGQWVGKSSDLAFEWFLRAANNQQSDAFIAVGNGYYLGRGPAQDFAQALSWFEKAANTGDSGAQYLAASMYETGLGCEANLEAALTWYSQAARQGDLAAKAKAKELAGKIADQQKGTQ
jgi:uncharacterized protein